MTVSTKRVAGELQKSLSNASAEDLYQWMSAVQASLAALAAQVDTDRGTGTAGVDAITVEE